MGSVTRYSVRYIHKVATSAHDVLDEPIAIPDNAMANRNTLAKALRDAKVLIKGARIAGFRVEGNRVIVFPVASIWHSVILTTVES